MNDTHARFDRINEMVECAEALSRKGFTDAELSKIVKMAVGMRKYIHAKDRDQFYDMCMKGYVNNDLE